MRRSRSRAASACARMRTVRSLITSADDEHHGEGEQVLRVGDREREVRRHEEEVERGHAEDGGARIDGPRPKRVATTTTPSR